MRILKQPLRKTDLASSRFQVSLLGFDGYYLDVSPSILIIIHDATAVYIISAIYQIADIYLNHAFREVTSNAF